MGGISGSTQAIGVLGGTFDPPHYGHLVLAENARVQLGLERVLFVPAGQPPHKPEGPITSPGHRLGMVHAAIADHPAFELSRVDLDRRGPHYTVDTLARLRQEWPEAQLFFLLGEDSLHQLPLWHNPTGIIRLARLAVMPRPGYTVDIDALEQTIPGISDYLTWLDVPHLDISSSDLRRRIRAGLPIRYLTPPLVEEYIRKHHLYTDPTERT
ncbi:MAG: nicotinate-nucleotide adenylyltransferase [Anaerolineae bacterium]|nr:nicotinate-nucleotide adenylyltransferase [Anaerolineae bacterium]